jgi:hypothetical protein
MTTLKELINDEQRRLAELLNVNYALALNGDKVSTEFCLTIMRRRCDLAGLNPQGGLDAAGVDPKAALLARLETIAGNIAKGGPDWRASHPPPPGEGGDPPSPPSPLSP